MLALSLRDDVLDVPRYGTGLRALSHAERVELFRRRLLTTDHRDEQGRISVPFSTELGALSPRTWGHKVLSVEAELVGADLPEEGARLYLVQDGASLVRSAAGDRQAYGLPPVTAVIDAGTGLAPSTAPGTSLPAPRLRTRPPGLHDAPLGRYRRSFRFRERPLVNAGWRLVIDLHGEPDNAGLRLGALDDVVLRIFYTDYTAD